MNDLTQKYIELFKNNQSLIEENSSNYLNKIRKTAFENFSKKGIPNQKHEDYKHLNISYIFDCDYKSHFSPLSAQVNMDELFMCDVPQLETTVVLFINGWKPKSENQFIDLGNGAFIGSLSSAFDIYPNIIDKYLNKNIIDNEFSLLNTVFSQDGIILYVPEGVNIEKPIQIINLLHSDSPLMVNPRNLFIIEKNASAKVVVCDHTLSPVRFLTNRVTEIYVEENANFDYYKMQNEHNGSSQISSTFITQQKRSTVYSNVLSLHGGCIRNNLVVQQNGEGCEGQYYGLYLTDKSQHIDNFTRINHNAPNCNSKQLYKGILDDLATGSFSGRVYVDKIAQKTNALQANNNILLSDDSKMYTKPQLEIYADDVKCSHGATIGQIDDDASFYLRARGISKKDAKILLMGAFVEEVVSQIRIEPLRERITNLVSKRISGELSRCASCAVHCG